MELTRKEIEERLTAVNADSKRLLRMDGIGRENRTWATHHRLINNLLDQWEKAK